MLDTGKIRRIDFEIGNLDDGGQPIGPASKVSVLYNTDVILYEEVQRVILNERYKHDERVVFMTRRQADYFCGKLIP